MCMYHVIVCNFFVQRSLLLSAVSYIRVWEKALSSRLGLNDVISVLGVLYRQNFIIYPSPTENGSDVCQTRFVQVKKKVHMQIVFILQALLLHTRCLLHSQCRPGSSFHITLVTSLYMLPIIHNVTCLSVSELERTLFNTVNFRLQTFSSWNKKLTKQNKTLDWIQILDKQELCKAIPQLTNKFICCHP